MEAMDYLEQNDEHFNYEDEESVESSQSQALDIQSHLIEAQTG